MGAEDGERLGLPVPGWRPPPAPGPMVLEGRLIRLEPLSVRHVDDLHEATRHDDSLWDYMGHGPFASAEGMRDWVRQVEAGPDPLFFALCDPASGRAQGVASYLRIAPGAGSIEVGWITFGSALQRSPAATEAMFLMMGWAFGAGYRRYEWKCNALNLPSRRAAERLGLSYEGTFRQALVVKGRNRDTAWFAAIDKEWPLLEAAFRRWLDPGNFDAGGRQRIRLSDLTRPVLVTRDPMLAK